MEGLAWLTLGGFIGLIVLRALRVMLFAAYGEASWLLLAHEGLHMLILGLFVRFVWNGDLFAIAGTGISYCLLVFNSKPLLLSSGTKT